MKQLIISKTRSRNTRKTKRCHLAGSVVRKPLVKQTFSNGFGLFLGFLASSVVLVHVLFTSLQQEVTEAKVLNKLPKEKENKSFDEVLEAFA